MKNTKVLVMGASGMAGHVVATYLEETGYEISTLSGRTKLNNNTHIIDVTKTEDLSRFLDNNNYDIIVNCIGALIQQSSEQKEQAILLNSYLPHYLESKYKSSETKIIHLSTDCVFSGENGPYSENSPYDGQIFYDRSKALGEIDNTKDLTFRMSIIGPDMSKAGVGLFNWFMQQNSDISGYSNVLWNGITTIQLAKAIKSAIEQNITGLYHLVPVDNISKYNLLVLMNRTMERGINISINNGPKSNKTLLNNRTDFDYTVTSYSQMILEMREWILKHNNLYKHYNLGE